MSILDSLGDEWSEVFETPSHGKRELDDVMDCCSKFISFRKGVSFIGGGQQDHDQANPAKEPHQISTDLPLNSLTNDITQLFRETDTCLILRGSTVRVNIRAIGAELHSRIVHVESKCVVINVR